MISVVLCAEAVATTRGSIKARPNAARARREILRGRGIDRI
jgi:hypothetical protein